MKKSIDKPKDDLMLRLEEVGLSYKESLVYLDMISREDYIGTSKIVRSTGLHGQFVYNALDTLESRGLAKHVIVGKRKRYAATDPARLLLVLEQKKRSVTELVRELESKTRKNRSQDFEFYLGGDAFVANEFDELARADEGETWNIIAGSGDRFYTYFEKQQLLEFDERIAKRITIRYIGSESQRDDLKGVSKARPLFEYRLLKGFEQSIVNTIVRPKSLSLSTCGDVVLTYKVTNDQVAESYKNFFDTIWRIAAQVRG